MTEHSGIAEHGQKKSAVAFASMLTSLFLALAKLVVGLLTGSLAILSEAAHALLDLGAATLTWLAVGIADRPADAGHPFGHGKVESLSALIETGLLFVTGVWIIYEALSRLFEGGPGVQVTWYALVLIALSMVIDFTRARALRRVARETGSQALEADALHFTSDILSSAAVLVGLLLTLIWPGADAVAAIAVALFVMLAGYRLGKRTVDVLIDSAPEGAAEHLTRLAATVSGVVRVERVRARQVGATLVAEMQIQVSRSLALEQVEALRESVATRIREQIPDLDLAVIARPLSLDNESLADVVRAISARHELPVHGIRIYEVAGAKHIGFDAEVDERMTIEEAHARVTRVEEILESDLAGAVRVDIHIDPIRHMATTGQPVTRERSETLAQELQTLAARESEIESIHDLHVHDSAEGLYVSFHCLFRPQVPVGRVHDLTQRLELDLRRRYPNLGPLVIHAEPAGAAHAVHHHASPG